MTKQENKQEFSLIKSRISEYLDFKGVSHYAFYKEAGVTRGVLTQSNGLSEDNLHKFLAYAQDISTAWLLTGQGDKFLKDFDTPIIETNATPQNIDLSPQNDTPIPGTKIIPRTGKAFDRRIEHQEVPLYDFDAVAGLLPVFNGQSNPVDYIHIPNLPKVDGAVPICGDSMYPLLKSGDIVMYKVVNDLTNIIWGEMYLISMSYGDDDYTAVKYLNRVEADPRRVLLVSHNTHHAPKEIPIESIRALGLIKATVRFNTMG